jgi:GNAT superfamily N-acetyltransferase
MTWRPMRPGDLAGVMALATVVHPGLPEREAVFAERLLLYPAGCFVHTSAQIDGYLVSHPWRAADPPTLDTLLGQLPAAPEVYYLHALALHPALRGQGAAGAILRVLAPRLAAFEAAELVAVNASVPFWRHWRFEAADPPGMAAKLAAYGADARFMRRTTIT